MGLTYSRRRDRAREVRTRHGTGRKEKTKAHGKGKEISDLRITGHLGVTRRGRGGGGKMSKGK
jgi:hypothetical protein